MAMAPISFVLFTWSEKKLAASLIHSSKMSFYIDVCNPNAREQVYLAIIIEWSHRYYCFARLSVYVRVDRRWWRVSRQLGYRKSFADE